MSSPSVRLRPGVHVVRRDATQVQIGLDPPARVLVPAEADCLHLIEQLRHGAELGALEDRQARLLRELRRAGLLADPPAPPRPSAVVAVRDLGLGAGVTALAELLDAAGVRLVSDATESTADLVVACSAGPLPRATVDPWVAEGVPHLVVCGTGRPGSLRVGPLVEPGLTACLRCVDAAEATDDPRRQLIVEQLARLEPAPLDRATLTLAVAWAARDVAAFVAGRPATTWSATLDADEPAPVVRRWSRHPACGCCWDELPY